IAIEALDAQALQGSRTSLVQGAPGCVMGIELAHDHDLVAPPANRLADHRLRASLAVHFRGVDELDAQVEAEAQGGHLVLPARGLLTHVPCPHAEARQAHQTTCASAPYCGFTRELASSLFSA